MTAPLGDSRPHLPRKRVPGLAGLLLFSRLLSSLLWKLLLLHYKASTDVQDNYGNTPLHLACAHGHEDVSVLAALGCRAVLTRGEM